MRAKNVLIAGFREISGRLHLLGGMRLLLFLVAMPPCVAVAANEPLSLIEAYSRAREYDAQYKVAQADREISREEVTKATSAFLPNVHVSLSKGRNVTKSSSFAGDDEQYYNTLSNGILLRQSVFNMGSIAAYKQAKAVSSKSESLLLNEGSSLIVRTVEAFLNVLYADENHEVSKAQSLAGLEQVRQTMKKYRDGFGTLTDMNEARASYERALADEALSLSRTVFSRRELERLTGVYAERLCRLSPEKLVLKYPEPANVDEWIELAQGRSHKIHAARHGVEVARKEVARQTSAGYPVVDLLAGKNYVESENNVTIGSTYDTWSISVQASVPLYTGDYNGAMVRQAKAGQMKAANEFNWQERATRSDIQKFFDAQVNGIAQVNAYEQVVRAQTVALEGNQKAYMAGFRNNVDVLDAQQRLFDSRRSLARARYLFLLSQLQLKDAAGVLGAADLEALNSLFCDCSLLLPTP